MFSPSYLTVFMDTFAISVSHFSSFFGREQNSFLMAASYFTNPKCELRTFQLPCCMFVVLQKCQIVPGVFSYFYKQD